MEPNIEWVRRSQLPGANATGGNQRGTDRHAKEKPSTSIYRVLS
ncbi:hypothetical protein [Coleofasciculus sp. FACHB-SPT9]|nr:hypothetical protein [Coleofasciculus sp. FACHB-SPT9]